jgi:hypothetical protein
LTRPNGPATTLPQLPVDNPGTRSERDPAMVDAPNEPGTDGTTDLVWGTLAYDPATGEVLVVTGVRAIDERDPGMRFAVGFVYDDVTYTVTTEYLPDQTPTVTIATRDCRECRVSIDHQGSSATVRVPLRTLNDVVRYQSGSTTYADGSQHRVSPPMGPGSTVESISWETSRIRKLPGGTVTDVPDDADDASRTTPWQL